MTTTTTAVNAVPQRLVTWSQVAGALRGPKAISLVGCLILLVPSALATASIQAEESGGWFAALPATISVTVFSGLLLWLASSVILRERYVRPVPLASVLLVYFIVGATRPVFLSTYADIFGQPPVLLDVGRVVQAGITSGVMLGLLAVTLDIYDRQVTLVRELSEESERLRALSERMLVDLADRRRELNEVVRVPVVRELTKVDTATTKLLESPQIEPDEVADAIDLVRNAVNQVVRPLATATRQGEPDDSVPSVLPIRQQSWSESARELVEDSWLVTPFQPLVAAVMLFLLTAPNLMNYFGLFVGVSGAAITSCLCFGIFEVARRSLRSSVLGQLRPTLRVLVVLIVYVVVAAVGANLYWLIYSLIFDTGYRVGLAAGLGLMLIPLFWLAAVVAASIRRQPRTVSDLRTISAALRFERDQRAIQLAEVKSAVADSLHGGVQSRLVAVILLLEQAQMKAYADQQAEARDSIVIAQSANRELITNVGLAKEAPVEQESFDTALRKIVESWDGLVAIEVQISPEAMSYVTATPSLAGLMIELIRECVTNAAKHGRAHAISIKLTVTGEMLRFTARDDGIGPNPKSRGGTGLKTLLGDTAHYTLTSATPSGAALEVHLPIRTPQPAIS